MDQKLPADMIFEVLIRTSLDTLDICKMVSRGWKKLIYDSTFFPFYLENTGTFYGFFIQDIYNCSRISQFVGMDQTGEGCINRTWPSGNVRILASCNQGIVCCEKRTDRNYRWYIGKPATEQWKVMPNPKLRHKTIGVAIIVSKLKPFHFNVIRLSKRNINYEMKMEYACEIFESKTWNWKRTQSVYLDYQEVIDIHQPAVTVGDFIYWKTSWGNVLTFHVTQQKFYNFSLPQTHIDTQLLRLVEYQGRLGCSCSQDGNFQLWIYSGDEWKRTMNVEFRVLEETFTYPNLVGFCNTGTSFMKAFNEAIFFNIEDDIFTHKEIYFELRHAHQVFQFRSDVEYVDLKCVDQDD